MVVSAFGPESARSAARIAFDSGDVALERQFDAFYERIRGNVLKVTPCCARPEAGFAARLLSFPVGRHPAHVIDAPSHSAARTARDLRSYDPPELQLSYMIRGSRLVSAPGTEDLVGPGGLFALDTRRPFVLHETEGRYAAVKLGFPMSEILPSGVGRGRLAPRRLAAHRLSPLLAGTCRAIGEGFLATGPRELAVLAGVAGSLLTLILGDVAPEEAAERADVFQLVRLEIERSLGDAEFGLAVAAVRLGLSPRGIQRVMDRHGTSFSALLRERRLALARRSLIETDLPIAEIAAGCGYSEVSAFYRAFRQRYGAAPAGVRRSARAGEVG